MIRVFRQDAASVSMIASSALLHLFVIGAVILFSGALMKKPPQETVTRIKLVDPAPGNPILEKVITESHDIAESPDSVEVADIKPLAPEHRTNRETITMKSLQAKEEIKSIKRKRTAKKLEAEEPPKKKEPEKQKEDPEAILEKRLAAIRQDVEKKAEAGKKSESGQKPSGAGGARGESNEEMNRWILGIKDRINAHWSIFGDRQDNLSTLISVQIEDDGSLRKALVDQSSGDKTFDLSAMRAVMQASPFPPVPSEVKEKIRRSGGLAFRFTPKGLQ